MEVSKRILFYEITEDSILMINSITGAIDIVDSKLYRSLLAYSSSRQNQIEEATTEALKRRGYLVEGSPSEKRRLRAISDAYTKAEKRLQFVVCPTYSCNLRCTYCFEGDLPNNSNAFMESADISKIFFAVDDLQKTFGRYRSSIELFGGEPLLPKTKSFVKGVFKEAKIRALPVNIVTNGVHLNLFADVLGAHREMIHSVQITLDGPQSIHDKRRKSANSRGTFEQASSSIDTLLSLQVKASVRVNIDLQNIEYLAELFDYMQSRGWVDNPFFSCNIAPVQDHSLSKGYEFLLPENMLVEKLFDALKKNPEMVNVFRLNMFRTLGHIQSVLKSGHSVQPLSYYCEANNLEHIVFGPDGYIYPCTECMGNKEMAIGEFRPQLKLYENAVNMWNGRNVFRMKKCRECDIALLCGGGCAYSALAVNGDINEPVCNNARETIFAYLDYIREELAGKASA